MSDEQPWKQQPGEPILWYDRFEEYRLLGTTRSLMAVYNRYRANKGSPKASKAAQAWHDASHKWRWRERVRAWDMSLIVARQEEWEEERRENKRLRLEALNLLREKVNRAITYINPQDARWPDVIAGLKAVLTESRAEYNDEPIQRVEQGAAGDFDLLASTLDSKLSRLAADISSRDVPKQPDAEGES